MEFLTEWSSRDRQLALAIEFYDGQTGEHGLPAWVVHDPRRKFTVADGIDFAAQALERARDDFRKTKASSAGVTFAVTDHGPPQEG